MNPRNWDTPSKIMENTAVACCKSTWLHRWLAAYLSRSTEDGSGKGNEWGVTLHELLGHVWRDLHCMRGTDVGYQIDLDFGMRLPNIVSTAGNPKFARWNIMKGGFSNLDLGQVVCAITRAKDMFW